MMWDHPTDKNFEREKKLKEGRIFVKDLKPYQRKLKLIVKVLDVGEKRDIVSRATGELHRIVETLVGDETGVILMTLWDDKVDSLEQGKTYEITNANTTVFRGSLRLNIGRYSQIKPYEEDIPEEEIDKSNNMSEKKIEAKNYRKNFGRRRFTRRV